MSKGIQIEDTAPYVSVVLAKYTGTTVTSLLSKLVVAIKDELKFFASNSPRTITEEGAESKTQGLSHVWIQYSEEKPPRWMPPKSTGSLKDRINHLSVAIRKGKLLAIYSSDPAFKASILTALRAKKDVGEFRNVISVPHKALADAFLQGAAQTLWLSSVGARTPIKADAKILSGTNLEAALSPLDDQGYHYTAARSKTKLANTPMPIGVSQNRSSVWAGGSDTWVVFCKRVKAILEAVEKAEKKPLKQLAPFRFLAIPVKDARRVSGAFDLSIVPPEVLEAGDGIDPKHVEQAEKWAYRSSFDITKAKGSDLDADAYLDGKLIGRISIEVDIKSPEDVSTTISGNEDSKDTKTTFGELKKHLRKRSWLKIRYDSAHSLSGGKIYSQRFSDVAFDDWLFVDLGENALPPVTDPSKEKPTPLKKPSVLDVGAIGKKDSLFCWVAKNWFGNASLV
jgi:hypothetical protein